MDPDDEYLIKPTRHRAWWEKILCICFPDNEEEEEIKPLEFNIIRSEYLNGIPLVFPSTILLKEEIGKIIFTEEGIREFVNQLRSDFYEQKFNQEGYKISLKKDSIFDQNNHVIRCEAYLNKRKFKRHINAQDIISALNDPTIRLRWDRNISHFSVLFQISPNILITRQVFINQLHSISEREFIEKRFIFTDNGNLHIYFSSIPNDFSPVKKIPKRCITYFGSIMVREEMDYIIVDSIIQVNARMSIEEGLIIMALPSKIKTFFDRMIGFLNGEKID